MSVRSARRLRRMGKASRRKRQSDSQRTVIDPSQARAPHVARPFEGLANESDWVALREIVPTATASISVTLPDGGSHEVTVATVLPGAMPALHRGDGEKMVALQSRTSSGDASRDIAQAILAVVDSEPGTPITVLSPATVGTPRVQDLVATDEGLEVLVHEDFSFWIAEDDDNPEVAAALEQTNAAAVPTTKIDDVDSAYWCLMGGRAYIRWILPQDEDAATTALARLQAAGEHTLGEGTTLLGAFRAAGLLVPVFEVDPEIPATEHGPALVDIQSRYAAALQVSESLNADERRARDGIISRQVTLR